MEVQEASLVQPRPVGGVFFEQLGDFTHLANLRQPEVLVVRRECLKVQGLRVLVESETACFQLL